MASEEPLGGAVNNYKYKIGDRLVSEDLTTEIVIQDTPDHVRAIGKSYSDHYRILLWKKGVQKGPGIAIRTVMYKGYIENHFIKASQVQRKLRRQRRRNKNRKK